MYTSSWTVDGRKENIREKPTDLNLALADWTNPTLNSLESDDENRNASYNPKPESRREMLETGQDLDATSKFDRIEPDIKVL